VPRPSVNKFGHIQDFCGPVSFQELQQLIAYTPYFIVVHEMMRQDTDRVAGLKKSLAPEP
jgi:hypothetical protein